jgi:hypothetical protein
VRYSCQAETVKSMQLMHDSEMKVRLVRTVRSRTQDLKSPVVILYSWGHYSIN